MKKLQIIIVLILINTYYLFSQTTFKKVFYSGFSDPYNYNIAESDSFYIFSISSSAFRKSDKNGNFITGYYGLNGGGNAWNNYQIHSNNNIIFVCAYVGYNSNFVSYDCSFDSVLFHKTYLDCGPGSIDHGFNSDYFICGVSAGNPDPYELYPLFIHVDSTGNLLNSYLFNEHRGALRFVYPATSTEILVALMVDTLGACILKMDTLGNVLWAKSILRPHGCFQSALQNADKSITILATADTSLPAVDNQPLLLMNIDTSGTINWCKSYGDSLHHFLAQPMPKLKSTPDGGYIICSTFNTKTVLPYIRDIMIIKTDAVGDTLWTRCHGGPSTAEYGSDITLASDGGYLIAGFSDTRQFQYGGYYFIKTDSLAMTASHCQEFNFPFVVNNISVNDSIVSFIAITGTISEGNQTIPPYYYPLPAASDGCLLSGLNEQANPLTSGLQAVPNPTTGIFKINAGNHTPKLTVYIYDIIGNLVFEKQYINQTEIELDLNNRGKGVYTVRVFDGEVVTFSKVVVE